MNVRPLWLAIPALFVAGVVAYAPNLRSQESPTVHLDQGWDAATIARYYHESQGAVIMPAAFLRALRTTDGKHFLDPARMRALGFLPGAPPSNPYPLGIAADDGSKTDGIPMAGITCAACHTGQLQYRGTVVRIEGGQGNVNLPMFQAELAAAVARTAKDPEVRKAFLAEAVSLGYPRGTVVQGFTYELSRGAIAAKAAAEVRGSATTGGPGTVDAFAGIGFNAFTMGLLESRNARKAIAPVNYPYLWDIWHFDWVQYNASVHQPMGRNVGEDIGLGARLNIVDPTTGKVNPEPARWKSTIHVKSLYWMETALARLRAPQWPAAFGAIDAAKAARGRVLFAADCGACHGIMRIAGSASNEWHVPVIARDRIGTDPNQAIAFASTHYDLHKIGLGAAVGLPEALDYVVKHVTQQAYLDARIPKDDWPEYNGFGRELRAQVPCGYKARPLIGVWATAPFLHNGAVPSLFDLLSQTRPSHPILGNPEFDPVRVGMVQQLVPGAVTLDTSLPGNSNAGHWFTGDFTRKGRIGPALSDPDKYAIIEYLKTATYTDYPEKAIASVPAAPCANHRDWAGAQG